MSISVDLMKLDLRIISDFTEEKYQAIVSHLHEEYLATEVVKGEVLSYGYSNSNSTASIDQRCRNKNLCSDTDGHSSPQHMG